jgi:hypothetical protein
VLSHYWSIKKRLETHFSQFSSSPSLPMKDYSLSIMPEGVGLGI